VGFVDDEAPLEVNLDLEEIGTERLAFDEGDVGV
jgi:hypothetical protein